MLTTDFQPDHDATEYLRVGHAVAGGKAGVDRQGRILRGVVLAEIGIFKDRRGEFVHESLRRIVDLIRRDHPKGLGTFWTHDSEHEDRLGKFLGRTRDVRVDGDKVKGNLHLSPAAFETPSGDLGSYVLTLAQDDPGAIAASLELISDYFPQRGADMDGPLPPVWVPTQILALALVAVGAATSSLLTPSLADRKREIRMMKLKCMQARVASFRKGVF